jgi:hypothetical protein
MNVVRTVLGWVTPLVILGGGIALFLLMGSQPPPARKEAASSAGNWRSRPMESWCRYGR